MSYEFDDVTRMTSLDAIYADGIAVGRVARSAPGKGIATDSIVTVIAFTLWKFQRLKRLEIAHLGFECLNVINAERLRKVVRKATNL